MASKKTKRDPSEFMNIHVLRNFVQAQSVPSTVCILFREETKVKYGVIIAFDEGERCLFTWFLPAGMIMSRGYRSRCQSISGFGRHLGLAHLASIPFGLAHVASIPCVTTASSKTIRYHKPSRPFRTQSKYRFHYTQ